MNYIQLNFVLYGEGLYKQWLPYPITYLWVFSIYRALSDFQTEILLTPRFSNQNASFSSVKEYSIEEYCNILCILVGN